MMPIINIHPLPSEERAESFRLSLKDADKFGLYCCHDGTSAMWSVIPKIALQLIFNVETALPVTERKWFGLTPEDTFEIGEKLGLSGIAWVDLMQAIEAKLKEKNT
jgi:hypothetical protein